MTILFLTEFFPRDSRLIFTGGVESRTYHIATLAKKDFKVKVIANPGKLIAATPLSVFSRFIYIGYAFFKALFTSFDLVEGSNVTSYLPAFFAGKLKGKKTVAWIPDVLGKSWFAFGPLVGFLGYILETVSLKLNWDKVIALSGVTRDKLLSAGVNGKKISVVHGGVNPDKFRPGKSAVKQGIICVARLVKTKRVKDLISALGILHSRSGVAPAAHSGNEISLTLVGTGPEKVSLKNQAERLGVSGRITWLENVPRPELVKLLQVGKVFCLPSVVEGFGLVTIEAMAAGMPAVVADLPVNRETCRDDQGALFFKPADPVDLADKLKQLLTDQKLYRQKQAEALKLIHTYSWEKIYDKTKTVYNS